MFKRLMRKELTSSPEPKTPEYAVALSGKDLLKQPKRTELISRVKRLFSVTEQVWNKHYLYAIEQFAELVQEVPASEIHHHSESGGLIDHTLEALYAGVRISQGYILPPNAEPESIAESADRWRFAAMIAILSHDLGKIVTDIEVVYRLPEKQFQIWHPWYGNIPPGAAYRYRFRRKIENTRLAKTLHEKSAMSLLPRLLTKEAATWLFKDLELISQLFSTISHSTFGGQVIAEIVRAADGASVSKNVGANTGKKADHTNTVPLYEKLIVSLRKLVNDGDLKRNKPGAAVWVTDQDTWVVSKATMEAVRIQLINEGHSGIPKNVVTLFGILNDHDCLVPNPDGDSVWYAEINDHGKNWQQKLTFLRFKNEIIWPTSQPDMFDGTVTPIDRNGNPLEISQVVEPDPDPKAGEGHLDHQRTETHNNEYNQKTPKVATGPLTSKITTAHKEKGGAEPEEAKEKQSQARAQPGSKAHGLTSEKAVEHWKTKREVQEDILRENDFLAWLLKGIARRQIRVNEPKAPVHILDGHVALVTPAIFNLFLDKNSLKKRLYEKRAGDKRVYTVLQRELEVLDIHQRGTDGQNIVTVSVEGQRSKSELKVYLLNRACFPSLRAFAANPAIKIHL